MSLVKRLNIADNSIDIYSKDIVTRFYLPIFNDLLEMAKIQVNLREKERGHSLFQYLNCFRIYADGRISDSKGENFFDFEGLVEAYTETLGTDNPFKKLSFQKRAREVLCLIGDELTALYEEFLKRE